MDDTQQLSPNDPAGRGNPQPPVVIHNYPPRQPWLGQTLTRILLVGSIIANVTLFGIISAYFPDAGATEKFKEGDWLAPEKIALIRVSGMITTETIASAKKELGLAAKDKDVKAVVLAVESPGGTISGSDELYHAIEKYKEQKKPLVVSMQGMATSGAYYIAVPADKIFAERSCITGSIGVIASLVSAEKLLTDWGIKPEVIKSGALKDSGSMFRSMTPEERKEWQHLIDGMYSQFLAVILKHRSQQIGGEAKLKSLADGRVYLAADAISSGLIDALGYQDDAITAAKELAQVTGKCKVITYNRPFGGWMESLGLEGAAPARGIDWRSLIVEAQIPQLLLMPVAPIGFKP